MSTLAPPEGGRSLALLRPQPTLPTFALPRHTKYAILALVTNLAELGLELARNRRRAGLSQSEVARRMGTRQSVISRAEAGRARPSLDFLERFSRATAVPIHLTLGAETRKERSLAERRRRVQSVIGDFVFDPWLRNPTRLEKEMLEARGWTREHFKSKRAS